MADVRIPHDEDAFALYYADGLQEYLSAIMGIERLTRDYGLADVEAMAGALIDKVIRDTGEIAQEMASASEAAIIHKMFATQAANRPHTGDMATHVVSRAGPLGSVFVGLLSDLDKIVNTHNSHWPHPYWRAQEYGTASHEGGYQGGDIPGQEGREIFGTFYESQEPPDHAQQGAREGHDLYFLPMGSAPGKGRISVELPARHFLRDGAAEVGADYLAAHAALRAEGTVALRAIRAAVRKYHTSTVTRTAIIEL